MVPRNILSSRNFLYETIRGHAGEAASSGCVKTVPSRDAEATTGCLEVDHGVREDDGDVYIARATHSPSGFPFSLASAPSKGARPNAAWRFWVCTNQLCHILECGIKNGSVNRHSMSCRKFFLRRLRPAPVGRVAHQSPGRCGIDEARPPARCPREQQQDEDQLAERRVAQSRVKPGAQQGGNEHRRSRASSMAVHQRRSRVPIAALRAV